MMNFAFSTLISTVWLRWPTEDYQRKTQPFSFVFNHIMESFLGQMLVNSHRNISAKCIFDIYFKKQENNVFCR